MAIYKFELQDADGNTFHPHTDATVVFRDGKPLTQVLEEQGGAVLSATPPENKRLLWIDTTCGLLKYHDGTAWVPTMGVYG